MRKLISELTSNCERFTEDPEKSYSSQLTWLSKLFCTDNVANLEALNDFEGIYFGYIDDALNLFNDIERLC